MAYRPTDAKSRWKAMLAALAVTSVMGAGILTGLNVEIVGKAIERLETFDIRLPEVPPPPPPPPPPQAQQDAGAPAAPKASPIVAPEPEIRVPTEQTVAAAREPGTGVSSAAGQGGTGTGTGAGGTGAGAGAGAGTGAGFTPAQRIQRIPDAEYRRLVRTSGMRSGRVGLTVKVNTDGRPSNCRIVRSSGNASADSLMCQLTERHVRFRPALDPQGRPIAQDVTWYPDWSPR